MCKFFTFFCFLLTISFISVCPKCSSSPLTSLFFLTFGILLVCGGCGRFVFTFVGVLFISPRILRSQRSFLSIPRQSIIKSVSIIQGLFHQFDCGSWQTLSVALLHFPDRIVARLKLLPNHLIRLLLQLNLISQFDLFSLESLSLMRPLL